MYDAKLDSRYGCAHKSREDNCRPVGSFGRRADKGAKRIIVYIMISSVPSEYRVLITKLETLKEDQLKWNYVRRYHMITEYGRIKGS